MPNLVRIFKILINTVSEPVKCGKWVLSEQHYLAITGFVHVFHTEPIMQVIVDRIQTPQNPISIMQSIRIVVSRGEHKIPHKLLGHTLVIRGEGGRSILSISSSLMPISRETPFISESLSILEGKNLRLNPTPRFKITARYSKTNKNMFKTCFAVCTIPGKSICTLLRPVKSRMRMEG